PDIGHKDRDSQEVSSPRRRGPNSNLARAAKWVPAFAGMTRGGWGRSAEGAGEGTDYGHAPNAHACALHDRTVDHRAVRLDDRAAGADAVVLAAALQPAASGPVGLRLVPQLLLLPDRPLVRAGDRQHADPCHRCARDHGDWRHPAGAADGPA